MFRRALAVATADKLAAPSPDVIVAMGAAHRAALAGKHVVQTQSYGPAARGGASKAEAIIADDEIDYPEVDTPDVSLCLSQAAYEKYARDTRPGGLREAEAHVGRI